MLNVKLSISDYIFIMCYLINEGYRPFLIIGTFSLFIVEDQ